MELRSVGYDLRMQQIIQTCNNSIKGALQIERISRGARDTEVTDEEVMYELLKANQQLFQAHAVRMQAEHSSLHIPDDKRAFKTGDDGRIYDTVKFGDGMTDIFIVTTKISTIFPPLDDLLHLENFPLM